MAALIWRHFQNARTRGDPHTHSIQRVQQFHEGLYTCVVGNGILNNHINIKLKVKLMFSYLRRYKECMYLHLGQSSEFNSAQLPSFLHCPPFFEAPFFWLLESMDTQCPEQNLCGLLLSWCWWSPMMWKRWWTRNRKGMIDASNGCNDDKAQSRLLESEPLPLINNDTTTGSVRERKTDFWQKWWLWWLHYT